MAEQNLKPTDGHESLPVGYESPRVERVLTLAELEREILYAGAVAASVEL